MTFKYGNFTKMGPIFGCSFKNLMKLLISNGKIAVKHYPRIFFMYAVTIVGIPFRVREKLLYSKRIKRTKIVYPPIFIIGHWRSGTTHLHNLLCQDPQFGFINMLQASFPNSFLSNNFFKFWMKKLLPETRPMDNMKMGVEEAQEDEMALGNLIPYTFYNALYFPKRMVEYYHRYVRFRNISSKISQKWKYNYDYLLKTTTLNMKGKCLILKNPVNTARIRILLELYPDAKFIHIFRNPYIIFLSTRHFYKKAIEQFMFQKVSKEIIERNIVEIYKNMMKVYLNQKKLIPNRNLVEIRFEDLELDPLNQLKIIYTTLKLPGFEKNKDKFTMYLKQLINYKKNKFQLNDRIIELIRRHWDFTITKWNYQIPDVM
ncbi:MAG: sulfotransferase [Promethearchaeota archaeon]